MNNETSPTPGPPQPLARLTWLPGTALATLVTVVFILGQGLTFDRGDGSFAVGLEIESWIVNSLVVWIIVFLLGIRPWRLFISPDPGSDPPWPASLGHNDRMRVWWAVTRYDFWLDWYDTPRGTRAPARRELRANLEAAAEQTGAAQAVTDLGDLRLLAFGTAEGLRIRRTARLNRGVALAGVAFGVLLMMWLSSLFAFAGGAMATADVGRASGTVFPWASTATVDWSDEAISVESQAPWLLWALPLLCFVAAGRPWRLLARRR